MLQACFDRSQLNAIEQQLRAVKLGRKSESIAASSVACCRGSRGQGCPPQLNDPTRKLALRSAQNLLVTAVARLLSFDCAEVKVPKWESPAEAGLEPFHHHSSFIVRAGWARGPGQQASGPG